LVQVYTGNGKTTAAFGLALRACGQGMKVFIGQFAKGRQYGELVAAARVGDCITVRHLGRGVFKRGRPAEEDIALARQGWEEALQAVRGGAWDLVILDEIVLHFGLVPLPEAVGLLDERPAGIELVLTGRSMPPEIRDRADVVTEMRDIRHPYDRGVAARRGIEY
jgi:cob(I)alamin adenosyltransferase